VSDYGARIIGFPIIHTSISLDQNNQEDIPLLRSCRSNALLSLPSAEVHVM
jgi:hypothetical protein